MHRLEFLALKWSVCEKCSHWLRGNTFTVWTDNNPLTYIMTKPKLDACEQRWVSKLAPYTFDLKHIPGTKNIVADTLSRDPFAKTVSQRLITERYDQLVTEAEGIALDSIQDTFRLKVQCQRVKSVEQKVVALQSCSVSQADINALLDIHNDWEAAAETRAVQYIQAVQDKLCTSQDPLPVFTLAELQQSQESDPTISVLIPFVSRKQRPSRRDRAIFDPKAMILLKQFERLKLQNGVLYRVTKDPISKHTRHQFVLPETLKERALYALHDIAGHQGQARTMHLARQRFFWPKMELDVKEYVKCCQRCIFSKNFRPFCSCSS